LKEGAFLSALGAWRADSRWHKLARAKRDRFPAKDYHATLCQGSLIGQKKRKPDDRDDVSAIACI
jgi:hypothetical protein